LKKTCRYSLFLLFLSILLIAACYIFNSLFITGIALSDIIWLTLAFFVLAVICLFIFFRGQRKDEKTQLFYTLVSISLKFLIELVIALIWFLILKKTEISFIVLFFVLYLTFTIISIFVILNTLKNKSL
jgi:hypothetical protein